MDDLISRSEAIKAVHEEFDEFLVWDESGEYTADEVERILNRVPSVQPERKTGKWLIRRGITDAQCSECKMYFNDVYDMDNSDAFCRHCGAKMEGLKVVKGGIR